MPLRQKDLYMISTTDFFYPLVDDPYMQGRIGCANVLSDMYSFGVYNIDNVLMILAASTEMPKEDRDISTKLMIKGFTDLAKEAGTMVTGGQTVQNPWPIIGGTATSVCTKDEFIMPISAVPGDVLVLTKALGTQVAVNLNQWRCNNNERWQKLRENNIIDEQQAIRTYEFAMEQMARLNRNAAMLLHKYKVHACTDVTGFGIMGHGNNLVKNQKLPVNFHIHTLPVIKHVKDVVQFMNNIFKFLDGLSAETSGGLLICLPRDQAQGFCAELSSMDPASSAWIIGDVVAADHTDTSLNCCTIAENRTYIEV